FYVKRHPSVRPLFPYTPLFRSGVRVIFQRPGPRGAPGETPPAASAGDGSRGGSSSAGRHEAEFNSPAAQKLKEQICDIGRRLWADRKSTRLNTSHVKNSYAVFC